MGGWRLGGRPQQPRKTIRTAPATTNRRSATGAGRGALPPAATHLLAPLTSQPADGRNGHTSAAVDVDFRPVHNAHRAADECDSRTKRPKQSQVVQVRRRSVHPSDSDAQTASQNGTVRYRNIVVRTREEPMHQHSPRSDLAGKGK